jgi:hypothetical protein
MLEAIKLIGAIVGLATGVFTVWDRWARGRPLAWLTATVRTAGTPPEMYIRISNPGPTDVLIQSVRVRPATYGVAKDHSAKGRKAFFEGVDLNLLLRLAKEHDLPIIERENVSRRVCFFIYWRKTSSSYLRQFPVVIMTSTHDIQRIAAAAS